MLPSTFEPWGLVVNEALAAGLPVLVSEACGCVPELVDTKNGYVFNPNKQDELVTGLNKLRNSANEDLKLMEAEAIELMGKFSPTQWSSTLHEWANE